MEAYYAAFIPSENGQYSVFFPDFPGCTTWGESLKSAFEQAIEALEVHISGMVTDKEAVPAPMDYALAQAKVRQMCADIDLPMPGETIFQLVPAPEVDAVPIRVTVSIRRATLDMIDRKAEAAGMTRSGFLAAAAARFESHPHS